MNNTDLIKELRALTQAGMKDCKDAIEEAAGDLQKAVDLIKVKGLNIVSGREGKVASEGRVAIDHCQRGIGMIEINCQTDFVANSPDFQEFARCAAIEFVNSVLDDEPFDFTFLEQKRQDLVSTTKENVVVRRWWFEEAISNQTKVFSYVHSNAKIGVLITMQARSEEAANSQEFKTLGEDLAMQIAAMNPLAVSADRLPLEEIGRQRAIFETQLKEDIKPKPEAMWPKILEGKFRKWNTEVCLLEQESVVVPKTTVQQVIKNVGTKLGGEIQVVNFIRCQVGEGLEVKKESLAREVEKMTGITQPADHNGLGSCCGGHCNKSRPI